MFKKFLVLGLLLVAFGCGANGNGGNFENIQSPSSPHSNQPDEISIFGKYSINNAKCGSCTLNNMTGETTCDFNNQFFQKYLKYLNGTLELQESPPKVFGNEWQSTEVNYTDVIAPHNVTVPHGSQPNADVIFNGIEIKAFLPDELYCTAINKNNLLIFEFACTLKAITPNRCEFTATKI